MRSIHVLSSRRRSNRFSLERPIVFSWKSARLGREKAEGTLRDVSAHGLFVIADRCPPPDAKVQFELGLGPTPNAPAQLCIKGSGRVVRIEPILSIGRCGFAVHTTKRMAVMKVAQQETGPEARAYAV